jgi:hypothetical protein
MPGVTGSSPVSSTIRIQEARGDGNPRASCVVAIVCNGEPPPARMATAQPQRRGRDGEPDYRDRLLAAPIGAKCGDEGQQIGFGHVPRGNSAWSEPRRRTCARWRGRASLAAMPISRKVPIHTGRGRQREMPGAPGPAAEARGPAGARRGNPGAACSGAEEETRGRAMNRRASLSALTGGLLGAPRAAGRF